MVIYPRVSGLRLMLTLNKRLKNMNEIIEINGEQYKKVNSQSSKLQIIILQQGWVLVGRVSQDDDMLTISDCAVIRVWGTTRGIGEIAMNGPTDKTILDKCTDNIVHILTVVTRMDCEQGNW